MLNHILCSAVQECAQDVEVGWPGYLAVVDWRGPLRASVQHGDRLAHLEEKGHKSKLRKDQGSRQQFLSLYDIFLGRPRISGIIVSGVSGYDQIMLARPHWLSRHVSS